MVAFSLIVIHCQNITGQFWRSYCQNIKFTHTSGGFLQVETIFVANCCMSSKYLRLKKIQFIGKNI